MEIRCVVAGRRRVALVRVGAELFAVDDECTHDYESLSDGGWVKAGAIQCPAHGACFDLRTGASLTPQAESDLATYPVCVVDDEVEITVGTTNSCIVPLVPRPDRHRIR